MPTDEQTQPEESAAVKPAGSPWRGAGKDQRPVQKRGSPNGRQNAARALFEGRPKNGLWSSQSGAYHRANPMNAEEQWLNQPVMVSCLGLLFNPQLTYLRECSASYLNSTIIIISTVTIPVVQPVYFDISLQ